MAMASVEKMLEARMFDKDRCRVIIMPPKEDEGKTSESTSECMAFSNS